MLTRKEIADKYEVTDKIIRDDLVFLGIKPAEKGDRNVNLYTERDCDLVGKLREHCQSATRETFIKPSPTQVVNDEPKDLIPTQPMRLARIERPTVDAEKFIDACRKLQEISDNSWLPSTAVLASIVGVTTSTLLRVELIDDPENPGQKKKTKPRLYFGGFICTIESQWGNTFAWKVHANNS